MPTSTMLVSFLLLSLASRPLNSKMLEVQKDDHQKIPLADIFRTLLDGIWDKGAPDTLQKVISILTERFLRTEALTNMVGEKMESNKYFLKPILKFANKMRHNKKVPGVSNDNYIFETLLDTLVTQNTENEFEENDPEEENGISAANFQGKLLEFVMNAFDKKLGNLDLTFVSPTPNILTEMTGLNSTYSTIWMIVKSTWQRILAYVEDENSLETFMQLTPFIVIDNIISLGDDLNLMTFLAKKLDKDFSEFLASEINPYLGALKNFQSFYNFTKENGFNGVIDYFTSDKFTYTINVMSKLISAYLENTVSDDLVNQYIEFISFNNTELLNFYKSVLKSQGTTVDSEKDRNASTKRFRRDVLANIANSYIKNPGSDQLFIPEQTINTARQLNQRYGPVNTVGLPSTFYDPSRDGGYGYGGGGGYGMNMNTLDPYVVLGALALGTILGFLIFRALRGTANGRRDIGDGSLSLWDSDLPDKILPWGSSFERMKRQVHDDTQGFSLPPSLRGDVWSSDPLVADNFLDDHLNEDDIARHLNHLWRLYKDNNETACVHFHLCDVMANSTLHHLTGKDSSLALLMASVGNLLGLAGSGQLVDDVTSSLVVGNSFSCPSSVACHQF